MQEGKFTFHRRQAFLSMNLDKEQTEPEDLTVHCWFEKKLNICGQVVYVELI